MCPIYLQLVALNAPQGLCWCGSMFSKGPRLTSHSPVEQHSADQLWQGLILTSVFLKNTNIDISADHGRMETLKFAFSSL